ncbi:MAG: helix-turn-helix domain-containing protein [Candidatus Hydrogenedentes bacterium]|nr:helix-turn-helix domain-containing protein [Candidatus Hydrogenedentota bacterium]
MITNERQYRITKAQLSKMKEAVQTFDVEAVARRTGSTVLAKAELEALRSEVEVLSAELREYETLKSGTVTILKAHNLEALPGILVRARIARGLSQRQLADMLGLREQQIQRYESENYASASLRRLSEVANVLQLNINEVAELGQKETTATQDELKAIDWSLFPVEEMYRRNWFEGFSGSLAAAKKDAAFLAEAFVTSVLKRPAVALHRTKVRSGSEIDRYALMAWECRVLKLVEKSPPQGRYIPDSLDDSWLKRLVRESRHIDGPIRAKSRLNEAGIALVIEPHLTHTHLDGAALLHQGKAIVALTLRYDRRDNFWFVLLHELIHVAKHLSRGRLEHIFDDLESEPDKLEREADELATRALIPDEDWETALARYVRSEQSVNSLAEKMKVSPAIIAGRIRNEANNYVILNNLIGQGEVRKHFPEVKFGS